ncbi:MULTISPECIES: sulfite exporter TauE/SafE family protein [Pseudomonadota]|jgi:uncharacterized membrane protein YfcA|uniref:sulfite exporter TauE/SafE family protein n=1 Tax=Pseudomonadota TaxID=1224 RepID=UPI000769C243|nr:MULTISPECIES: sulfite exporter TauE/SafE family protein [Pseudomonadota]MAF61199.1 sulfite exporter TauE/SafE family protein [Blastomonas sp.]|tara:strand:- start:59624 stop:60394 length:771 start_codon:yes stop_codon:yes gene_type:complete
MIESLALAALGGAIVGLLLAAFGGGGSVLATPWLIYVVGVADVHVAIGTSAAGVAINALAGLLGQARAGAVKWPCASVFALAGVTGAMIGAHFAKQVDGEALLGYFAAAMALVALSMMRAPASTGDPAVRLDAARTMKLAPIGLLVGLAAGFFGIGGGFLIAPGLMAATGMTLSNAAASSLVSVSLFGASTSASYAMSGQIDGPILAAMVAGGALGTVPGIFLARVLARRVLIARRLFAAMVLLVALLVLWNVLAA